MSPKSSRDWRLYADDIVEACQKIRRYVAGHTYDTFARDERTVDAVTRNVEVIGEAAKMIPEDVRARAPDIEWRKVCGMRDIVSHEYFAVDLRVVWDVAMTKIDALEAAVERLRAEQ